jgi:glycosyltransferase involved in cell wall biosynthesis
MRVLHFVTLPWQATEGIARACREIATALEDVESVLIADREPGAAAAATFTDVRVLSGWAPTLPWRAAFARIVRELDPDVVHLHGGTIAPALAYAPSLRGRNVVATCYRASNRPRGAHIAGNGVGDERVNFSLARAALSSVGGLALARRALRFRRVGAICTPDPRIEALFGSAGPVLRPQGGGQVSAQHAAWSPHPTVVFAGRAQAARGIDDLIAAFPAVLESVPDARLLLALLPTPDAPRWSNRLAAAPWAEVRVEPDLDLEGTFAQCQVGAFPFRWSTTMTPALAAAEAMSVGLPIVATAVDCLSPLVEPGRNGVLVPPSDPVSLGRALTEILAAPASWQALSEGARKTIEERWSWSGAAAVTRDAYELAIARRRAA